MEITKTLLKKKFEDFNLKYFDNEVCDCDFRVINTDAYLGRLIDKDVIKPVLCVAKIGLIERKWSSLNRLEKAERILLTPINWLLMFVL